MGTATGVLPLMAKALPGTYRPSPERHGVSPTSAELHPKHEALAELLSAEGVNVNFVGGCLAWELRLGHDLPSGYGHSGPQEPAQAASKVQGASAHLSNFDAPYPPTRKSRYVARSGSYRTGRPAKPRGRPRLIDIDEKVSELAALGLSRRRIATELGVSEATVRRRLRAAS